MENRIRGEMKKFMAVLLAISVIIGYIPHITQVVYADNEAIMLGAAGTKIMVAKSKMGTQAKIPSGVPGLIGGGKSIYRVKYISNNRTQWVYCIDPTREDQPEGAKLSATHLEYSIYWKSLPLYKQNGIRKAIRYGYNNSAGFRPYDGSDAYDYSSSALPLELNGKVNLSEYWLATQYIIW